jgi:hypothetical protein
MTTPSLTKRLEALEATAPEHGLRVVHRHEEPGWAPEQQEAERRTFLAGLPRHRGLTVVIRKLWSPNDGAFTRTIEGV